MVIAWFSSLGYVGLTCFSLNMLSYTSLFLFSKHIHGPLQNSIHALIFVVVVLYRLAEGLNTLGLLDLMKIHPSIFKEVFSSSERPLKATDLISLFQAMLSPPGNNLWRLEKRVEGYWRDFLLDNEGK